MANDPTNPLRFGAKNYLSHGTSSIVFSAAEIVFKAPFSEKSEPKLQREREVYEHLRPGHCGMIKYYGNAYCYNVLGLAKHGSIRQVYYYNRQSFTQNTKLQWVKEIACTFEFIHSKNVFHGDISCSNIFLDENWATKVGDFAGSSIGDQEHLVAYETSYSIPGRMDVSAQTELFALGSTFYEIFTGHKPFADLQEHEIEANFANDIFPSLKSLPACQKVIENCWRQRYQNVNEMLADIDNESLPPPPHWWNVKHYLLEFFKMTSPIDTSTLANHPKSHDSPVISLTGMITLAIGIFCCGRFSHYIS